MSKKLISVYRSMKRRQKRLSRELCVMKELRKILHVYAIENRQLLTHQAKYQIELDNSYLEREMNVHRMHIISIKATLHSNPDTTRMLKITLMEEDDEEES